MSVFPTVLAEGSFTVGTSTSTYLQLGDPTRGLLGTGTLGPSSGDVWSDISEKLHDVTIDRGSTRVQSPILRYEAGTSTGHFKNTDRRFDPTNLSGPYVSAGATQVTPMAGIRYRAIYGGVVYDLCRHYLDAGPVSYDGPNYSAVEFRATDAFKMFGGFSRVAGGSVGAGEDTGARITRILNSAGWSAVDRMIATGDLTLQSTTLDGDALSEMQTAVESEIGDLYMDAGGRVVFRNRQAALEDLRSARPVALFGDQVTPGAVNTINLHGNPSVEVNSAGWIAGGFANSPSVALSSAQAAFGTQSLLATWATATIATDLPLVQCGATVTGLTPGQTYTFSVYVRVPAGSPTVFLVVAAVAFGSTSGGLTDQWVRLSCTTTVGTSSATMQLWPLTNTTAGQQVYIDGAQVEAGMLTAYCDGDQAGAEWDGNAGVSTSRRLVELPYADVVIDYDDTTLVNLVRATRVGGSVQTAEDATSQAKYGPPDRTMDRSDLVLQTDADAASWANWVLYQCKDPELRFSELTIKPQRDPTNLFPQVLGREIGDRIRIVRRFGGGTTTRDCFIRGVRHQIDCRNRTWVTKWTLQSATKYAFFVLGSTSLGVLGQNALA